MRLLQEMIKTQILTKIEHHLYKTKIKESQNIPPAQNLNLQDSATKVAPVKLPRLQNWQLLMVIF